MSLQKAVVYFLILIAIFVLIVASIY